MTVTIQAARHGSAVAPEQNGIVKSSDNLHVRKVRGDCKAGRPTAEPEGPRRSTGGDGGTVAPKHKPICPEEGLGTGSSRESADLFLMCFRVC